MWLVNLTVLNPSHQRELRGQNSCRVRAQQVDKQRTENVPGRERKPAGFWKNFANVDMEIRGFLRENGFEADGRLPSEREFVSARFPRADLLYPIRLHGGWEAVAAKLNLKPTSIARPRSLFVTFAVNLRRGRMMPPNYWKKFENLEKELNDFIVTHCEERSLMPTARQLLSHNRSDLIRAIRKHGGFPKVAERLRLKIRRKPNGFWDDEQRTFVELKKFIVEHSLPLNLVPTYKVMHSLGASGLANAVARHGGTARFAELLTDALQNCSQDRKTG